MTGRRGRGHYPRRSRWSTRGGSFSPSTIGSREVALNRPYENREPYRRHVDENLPSKNATGRPHFAPRSQDLEYQRPDPTMPSSGLDRLTGGELKTVPVSNYSKRKPSPDETAIQPIPDQNSMSDRAANEFLMSLPAMTTTTLLKKGSVIDSSRGPHKSEDPSQASTGFDQYQIKDISLSRDDSTNTTDTSNLQTTSFPHPDSMKRVNPETYDGNASYPSKMRRIDSVNSSRSPKRVSFQFESEPQSQEATSPEKITSNATSIVEKTAGPGGTQDSPLTGNSCEARSSRDGINEATTKPPAPPPPDLYDPHHIFSGLRDYAQAITNLAVAKMTRDSQRTSWRSAEDNLKAAQQNPANDAKIAYHRGIAVNIKKSYVALEGKVEVERSTVYEKVETVVKRIMAATQSAPLPSAASSSAPDDTEMPISAIKIGAFRSSPPSLRTDFSMMRQATEDLKTTPSQATDSRMTGQESEQSSNIEILPRLEMIERSLMDLQGTKQKWIEDLKQARKTLNETSSSNESDLLASVNECRTFLRDLNKDFGSLEKRVKSIETELANRSMTDSAKHGLPANIKFESSNVEDLLLPIKQDMQAFKDEQVQKDDIFASTLHASQLTIQQCMNDADSNRQDTLTKMRQLETRLITKYNSLNPVFQTLKAELQQSIEAVKPQLAEQLDQLKTSLEHRHDELYKNSADISKVEMSFKELRGKSLHHDQMSSYLGQQLVKLSDLTQDLDKRFNSLTSDSSAQDVEAHLRKLCPSIDQIPGTVNYLTRHTSTLNSQMQALGKKVTEADEKASNEELDKLRSLVTELGTQLVGKQEELTKAMQVMEQTFPSNIAISKGKTEDKLKDIISQPEKLKSIRPIINGSHQPANMRPRGTTNDSSRADDEDHKDPALAGTNRPKRKRVRNFRYIDDVDDHDEDEDKDKNEDGDKGGNQDEDNDDDDDDDDMPLIRRPVRGNRKSLTIIDIDSDYEL